MAVPPRSAPDQSPPASGDADASLVGESIAFVGKLVSMTRPEACQLVEARGGEVALDESQTATLVVIGDNQTELSRAIDTENAAHRHWHEDVRTGRAQLLRESQLWQRVGLIGDRHDADGRVQRLYTPAMLADLLDVPAAAIRRWHRDGWLVACRSVRRLPYFDFTDAAVARHLATLLNAGCSLQGIDRKLAELHRAMPAVARPLVDPSIVVSGRCLYRRRGDDLAEPCGQLLIDFDKPTPAEEEHEPLIPISSANIPLANGGSEIGDGLTTIDRMQEEAQAWEDQGEWERAAESYRAMLVAGGPVAEIQFALADLLYRMGDLSAARERFYAAIELDEEYVEARANLGCVLAESGELELAVAAFQGALTFHADYADVHYHLANALDRLDRNDEAELHWRTFLTLAPESPWAETTRTRLGESQHHAFEISESLS